MTIPEELQRAEGYRGGSVLLDDRLKQAALITWWETRENMQVASRILQQLRGTLPEPDAGRGLVVWMDNYRVIHRDAVAPAEVSRIRVNEDIPA